MSSFTTCGKGDCDEEVFSYSQEVMTPIQCFELLYSGEIVNFIVDMTNTYALQRNHTLNVASEEIRVYISILLFTGYLTPKYMRIRPTLGVIDFSKFSNIFIFVIVYPYHRTTNLLKYENILQNVSANFKRAGSSHISIDETIVPYFERHGTKQHIHGKPITFGYKLWSAATRHGYLVNCELDQCASGASLKMQSDFGLGAGVVLELHELPQELGPSYIYFDNCFAGLPLLKYLRDQNIGGTETVRENRLENCKLPNSKDMKKEPRIKHQMELLLLNGMTTVLLPFHPTFTGWSPSQKWI